jgi:LCP family protein required for cell wall assembly
MAKRIIWIIVIIAFIILLCGVIGVAIYINRPLGPSLELTTPTPEPATPTQTDSAPPTATEEVVVIEPTALPQGTCGNTGVWKLVIVGRASPNTASSFGADAVRLVVVDFDAPQVSILALPSEMVVNTPVLARLDIGRTGLNQVYQETWESAQGNPDAKRTTLATQALVQTIVDNFGFVPDHYITVEEAAFIQLINQMGGVEVFLTSQVDGTVEGYGIFPSGQQKLTGQQALNLARLLYPSGQEKPDTFGRLARQDSLLQGMLDMALKPENLLKIPVLSQTALDAVATDLSLKQARDLACMAEEVGSETELLTAGPGLVKTDAQGYLVPDLQGIKALIAQMGGGN